MSRPGQGLSTLRPAHRPSKTNVVRQLPSLLLGILGASRYRFRDAAGRIGWDHRAERRRQDNSAAADVRYYTAHLWGNQGGGADRPGPGARRRLRLGDDGPPTFADQRRGPWTAPVGYTQARTVDRRVCRDRPVYRSAGAALFRRYALAVGLRDLRTRRSRHSDRGRGAGGRPPRFPPQTPLRPGIVQPTPH